MEVFRMISNCLVLIPCIDLDKYKSILNSKDKCCV